MTIFINCSLNVSWHSSNSLHTSIMNMTDNYNCKTLPKNEHWTYLHKVILPQAHVYLSCNSSFMLLFCLGIFTRSRYTILTRYSHIANIIFFGNTVSVQFSLRIVYMRKRAAATAHCGCCYAYIGYCLLCPACQCVYTTCSYCLRSYGIGVLYTQFCTLA